jgi:tRNA pseudouridine38-40 synthase
VQETLENAIAKIAGERLRVLASGRTDAGVHALGQVVSFRTESSLPPEVFRRALNANLPHDIAVLDVAEAPDDFHVIGHVRRKRYRYVIHDGPVRDVFVRRFTWHYGYGRLDADAMRRAAAVLLGTHDFSSFESSGAPRATSVRTIFDLRIVRGRAGQGGEESVHFLECGDSSPLSVERAKLPHNALTPKESGDESPHSKDFIIIEIEADGFLYNMVRAIVGTLVQVGRGHRPESWPGEVLRAVNRSAAGPTAPPQGLCLVRVEY